MGLTNLFLEQIQNTKIAVLVKSESSILPFQIMHEIIKDVVYVGHIIQIKMFTTRQANVEFDLFPTSASRSRGFKNGGKINLRRIIKTGRKTARTKRVHVHHPAHPLRHLLRSHIIPIGFRIQRYKIRLIPLKRKLKQSKAFKKLTKSLKKSLKKSKGKH